MTEQIFGPGFKEDPYWWDDAPRPQLPEEPLPKTVDVAVVGSGYAGLNCALTIARADRTVLVVESQEPGHGASTRLAGYIGKYFHYPFPMAIKKFGLERTVRMFRESTDAQRALRDFIQREKIDVGLHWRGRFTAACSPDAYEAMARNAELMNKYISFEYSMCPRSEQRKEIGTDYYHGGLIIHDYGLLQPAKYHQGLLDAAIRAGARIAVKTPVLRIGSERNGFTVTTSRGDVAARDVVICTNGYTNTVFPAFPWIRQRIVPVPAFQICTEPLAPELMKSVKPGGRPVLDSKTNIFWDRPTPDDRRIIFGARTGHEDGNLRVTAAKLYELMVEVYPQLAGVKLSHVWRGVMGFSFDKVPHIGQTRDGVYFATGFCGAGLVMGTHFGQTVARRLLGQKDADTAFWNLGFPTWPFYNGTPWLLPLVIAWVDYKDRRGLSGHLGRTS